MSRHNLLGLPTTRSGRRLVGSLTGATVLLWIGDSAILPLLPTYLRRHGSQPALVGLIIASYFVSSVITQYPAGRLSDRIGRRPVVLAGLAIFAVGSVGFAVTSGASYAIAWRALQGMGAGAFTVAAAATIGTEVAVEERGPAFGALYGSQMLALAVGPLVGSLVGLALMRSLFIAAAGAAVFAAAIIRVVLPAGVATLRGPDPACYTRSEEFSERDVALHVDNLEVLAACAPGGMPHGSSSDASPQRERFPLSGAVAGVLLVFGATGLLAGVYESCWTLLLIVRHASTFEVGLSWTLFALPFALLSVPAGRLAGRFDRRLLALSALAVSAGFCALYPFLHSIVALIICCSFEAVGSVIGTPAAVLVLTESVPPERQGEAQGGVETARMAAMALAAAGSGALFGVNPKLPFVVCAMIATVMGIAVAFAWRSLKSGGRAIGGRPLDNAAGRGPGVVIVSPTA